MDVTCPGCGAPATGEVKGDLLFECGGSLDTVTGDMAAPCPTAERGLTKPHLRVFRGGITDSVG